jgi:hypothetical protein
MHRRTFLALPAIAGSALSKQPNVDPGAIDHDRILRAANKYLREEPVTVSASSSSKSAGGKHAYFSEGDYWWPDPKNPKGPYIRRDGISNPANFDEHRKALMRLSIQVPALIAAWKITRENRYSDHALRHLRAWFVDPETRMNPNLEYAQAIHGVTTGRGTGIIDTLHLVEVARAAGVLDAGADVRHWFAEYLDWMSTSKNGREERDAQNNHGTCWAAQAAEFARLTRNKDVLSWCSQRFKAALLPTQVAADGSFPLELKRTKPYSYSLFNMDVMGILCQTLLTATGENVFRYTLADGRGMAKVMAFHVPYIADKSRWPYPPDVMYFDQWPVRNPTLLFAGLALEQPRYVEVWKKLNPDPVVEEVIRNLPVRQPVLWV